eukprot:PITA_34833
MPLNPHMTLQPFEKWVIAFVGSIQPQGRKMGARYIITTMEYLTQWVEAQPIKDCTGMTGAKFLFEYVLMQFGCPNILMTDHGTHFLNETINVLTEEFKDLRIPTVLWDYQTTCKKLTGRTPFRLVYGVEVVIPMEYIVPSMRIVAPTGMMDRKALEERLAQLAEIEKERFLVGFHQQVQNQSEKAWHD